MYPLPEAGAELSLGPSRVFSAKDIDTLEKKFNATYVLDSSVQDSRGNWIETMCAIFYQETPPDPTYSRYVAIRYLGDNQIGISSGKSLEDHTFAVAVSMSGQQFISSYRHDFRTSLDGSVMIDGGRDYTRLLGDLSRVVFATLAKDKLVVTTR